MRYELEQKEISLGKGIITYKYMYFVYMYLYNNLRKLKIVIKEMVKFGKK